MFLVMYVKVEKNYFTVVALAVSAIWPEACFTLYMLNAIALSRKYGCIWKPKVIVVKLQISSFYTKCLQVDSKAVKI